MKNLNKVDSIPNAGSNAAPLTEGQKLNVLAWHLNKQPVQFIPSSSYDVRYIMLRYEFDDHQTHRKQYIYTGPLHRWRDFCVEIKTYGELVKFISDVECNFRAYYKAECRYADDYITKDEIMAGMPSREDIINTIFNAVVNDDYTKWIWYNDPIG